MKSLILAALTLMPLFVNADEIDRLILLTGTAEMIEKAHSECVAGSSQLLSEELHIETLSKNLGIAPGKDGWDELQSIYKEFYSVACEYASVSDGMKIWRNSYKNNLNKSEINELIKFYSSPLGSKAIKLDIKANSELQELISERYAIQTTKAQRMLNERINGLMKRMSR